MNDSLLYFLFYTAGCFGIGFAVGGLYEARKAYKTIEKMYQKHKEDLKALGDVHEKYRSAFIKHVGNGHDSSEHVPTYTA